MRTIDVMIPVYKPDIRLKYCVSRLLKQQYPVRSITLICTRDEDGPAEWERVIWQWFEKEDIVKLDSIPRGEFDHGTVRNRWGRGCDADILLYLVQDAVPVNSKLTAELADVLADQSVAVVYGRHIPRFRCDEVERYTRFFNYPPRSQTKSRSDKERFGIKYCFTSNVCAAYSREWFELTEGFVEPALCTEDSIFTAKAMDKGAKAVYNAEAMVFHNHTYNCAEQWQRNFDIGRMHARHPEVFGAVPVPKEGRRLAFQTLLHLVRQKKYMQTPRLFLLCLVKYVGYAMGKREERTVHGRA